MLHFSHDIQGLVESSIQTICTTTLMVLSFLDTPATESKDDKYIWTNVYGYNISFSFAPMVSLAFGFLSIIVYSGRAIRMRNIWKSATESEADTLILFMIATGLFRIQVSWSISLSQDNSSNIELNLNLLGAKGHEKYKVHQIYYSPKEIRRNIHWSHFVHFVERSNDRLMERISMGVWKWSLGG